jgi:hypothetical protein
VTYGKFGSGGGWIGNGGTWGTGTGSEEVTWSTVPTTVCTVSSATVVMLGLAGAGAGVGSDVAGADVDTDAADGCVTERLDGLGRAARRRAGTRARRGCASAALRD